MVLNRNEQKLLDGLFTPRTLDHATAWDGKYGTRKQSVWSWEFHQDYTGSTKNKSFSKEIDVSTYRLGISNPNWKQQIAAHEDAGTPFAATDVRIMRHSVATYFMEIVKSSAEQVDPWGFYDPIQYIGQSYFNYIPLYDTSQDHAVDNLAIRRFYDKLGNPFDGLTFLGELRETIHMFKKPLQTLHESIDKQIRRSRKLREKALRDARNRRNWPGKKLPSKPIVTRRALAMWRKAAGSSYLEWKWGVKPLMRDIEDLFEALKLKLNAPAVDPFKASAGWAYSLPPLSVGAVGGRCPATVAIDCKCHTSVKYTGAVLSQVDSSVSLADTLIGPPESLVAVAYELFPFSWLADYATTLGEAINAALISSRLRYTFVSKTVRHSIKATITVTPHRPLPQAFPPKSIKSCVVTPGTCVVEKKHVSRNPLAKVPLISLTWQHKISTGKVANLVAFAATFKGEASAFRNRNRL